jgi:asparagine synthase (glutamine-hydrolysing)
MNGFIAAFSSSSAAAATRQLERALIRIRQVGSTPKLLKHTVSSRFAGAVWSTDSTLGCTAAAQDGLLAIGDMRLENRHDIRRLAGTTAAGSDLELLLGAYLQIGEKVSGRLIGDFAFIIYDARADQVVAARDSFGIKRLFWCTREDVTLLSSSLVGLHDGESLDEGFVWSYLSGAARDPASSVWADIHAVAPARQLSIANSAFKVSRYWVAGGASPDVPKNERDQCEVFSDLLKTAVAACLPRSEFVWAELSGGLDSASVLGVANLLYGSGSVPTMIRGTYSFVDDMAGADENRFLRAILTKVPVRNERIANTYPWEDDGEPPPLTEEPRPYYPYWARDRRAERVVRSDGAAVVLSGGGSDFYLTGSPLFLADLLYRWKLWSAFRGAFDLATASRDSFWKMLWQYGLQPLYGSGPHTRDAPTPAWLTASFTKRSASLTTSLHPDSLKKGAHRFTHVAVRRELEGVANWHELPLTGPVVEKRYPFLNRPLVDFAVALRPNMRLRNATTKWVLRAVTQGIVPEEVRMRRSKGWIDGRTCWALSHQAALVSRLLRDPIVAQLGWVDLSELRKAVASASAGIVAGTMPLMRALSLETWLAVRAGRWSEIAPT